jgi:uncharacterized protein YgiB involved in biofilm formation
MTSDKLLSLENIRQQFRQDCVVVHKNFVFRVDGATLFMLNKCNEAIDKDGFPVPLTTDECLQLSAKMAEAWTNARKNYFDRMASLGIDKLTEVKSEPDEATE